MTEILKSLSTMTPQWLEEALTEAGHALPPTTAVDVRPMDDFVGAMGEVGIVSVCCAGEQDRAHRRFKAMMQGTIAAADRWSVAERMRAHTWAPPTRAGRNNTTEVLECRD